MSIYICMYILSVFFAWHTRTICTSVVIYIYIYIYIYRSVFWFDFQYLAYLRWVAYQQNSRTVDESKHVNTPVWADASISRLYLITGVLSPTISHFPSTVSFIFSKVYQPLSIILHFVSFFVLFSLNFFRLYYFLLFITCDGKNQSYVRINTMRRLSEELLSCRCLR